MNMQQFWIFGYGSLMWRPGFEHIGREAALVRGYHRSLCVFSFVHRGTPEQPGLVLGLDRGGSCHGLAFEIAAHRWDETISYLRGREQVTSVYIEKQLEITLPASARKVQAVTYVVDRRHRQYAGKLSPDSLLRHVGQSEGVSGHNIDYVLNTLNHLRDMTIHDPTLERLVRALGNQAGTNTC